MIYLVCMILLAMIVAPLVILVYILYRNVVKQREWNEYKKKNVADGRVTRVSKEHRACGNGA